MRDKRNLTWTPDLAYVVGLITTDGCISSNKRHIIFTSKDIDLILTFKSILQLKNEIGITRNPRSQAYRVQFGDVHFCQWLFSIGLTPKKSLTLGALAIPPEFFIDFLRGHLDGDGSITVYTDRYNTFKNPKYIYEKVFVRLISASEKHLVWLQEMIASTTELHPPMHKTKPNPKTGRSMYVIKFGKKDSLALLRRLYYTDSLPCLERKRAIAKRLIA